MTKTLDIIIDEVRNQPPETQEVLGRFIQASMAGEHVTLAEVEAAYRAEHTAKGLAEAERGEGAPVEDVRARIHDRLNTQQQ